MQKIRPFSLLAIMFIGLVAFSFVACGGDKAVEEPVVEETAPPPPPPPAPKPKPRAEVKKKEKPQETPEQFVIIEEDEVETIDEVEFIPHRFSYKDLEAESEPLHVNMKAFDVPPSYSKKCADQDNPDVCSSAAIQTYLKMGLTKYVDEMSAFENVTEHVSFIVNADGTVQKSDIRVLPQEPQCNKCAAIALELIRDMPKWNPATKGGTPVKARVTLPIRFVPPAE